MTQQLKTDPSKVRLVPMTPEMYHRYFKEYENDPDLYIDKAKYAPYTYSREKVDRYIQRQTDLKRITFAIMYDEEMVGEIIIKNIEPHKCATLGLSLKNAAYKDRGLGTQAEKLAIRYVFDEMDIPVLYADTIQTNARSQHVLEKVGFRFIRENADFKYYKIERDPVMNNTDTMQETYIMDNNMTAYCGVDCSSCSDYTKGECPGCRQTDWQEGDTCLPVECCRRKGISCCGECLLFPCEEMKEFYAESEGHEKAYALMLSMSGNR